MKIRSESLAMAGAACGAVLLIAGSDKSMLDPRFAFPQDPPALYTIVNSATTTAQLVRVQFNNFGTGFKLYASGVKLPGPRPLLVKPGGQRNGGGAFDPDPDERQLCPDLWPDPDDEIPLPDPPFPMPDYPDEDPFDGLPEPPPFDPNDMEISNSSDGTITIVNTGGTDPPKNQVRQSTVTGTIRVGLRPAGIAATRDRKTAVVANNGDDTVSIIQNRAVAGTIKLPPATFPYGIAINDAGTRAYVTSFVRTGGALLVLDIPNRTVVTTLVAGNFSPSVALTPDGSQVWVTSVFEDSVMVYDTLTNTVVTRIIPITNAWGIAFNPTGTRAYVTDAALAGGGVHVIDTATYKVITRISTGNAHAASW